MKDRFEYIAHSYPRNVALLEGGRVSTYEELNGRANHLAQALLDRLGEGEAAVAIFLEQGRDAIVAALGALKAGKICVPIDPSYPPLRAAQIAGDAQVALILARSNDRTQARALDPAQGLLEVDRLPTGPEPGNPSLDLGPERLCYLFYTSGSSGGPKGVIFTQRTLMHTILVQANSLHFSPCDRFSLVAPVGVGMSITALYGSLLTGGTLCPFVITEGGLSEIIRWVQENKVSVLQLTPSLFRRLAVEPEAAKGFVSLRMLKLSGEAALRSDFELYRRTCPPTCLLRLGYASTEAGIVTEMIFDHDSQVPEEQLPVGYPAPDVELRLCDEEGNPVTEGEGEIVVRSRYLSPGYWRRPDLTRAVFLEDASGQGERSCWTGDQGRLLADGCLILRGRKDNQVKVRGHRVDLSEVERLLLGVEGVREAAARTWERTPGEETLAAYVVAGSRPPPRPAELRAALRRSLPEPMIPSAFVYLESLPLTESGKVDRRALPVPAARPLPGKPPNTALEAQLCRIWEEVLGVRPVGVRDDFFDLGGTSLQALQLFERIAKQLGKRIPLEVILKASTVEEQARVLLSPGGTEVPVTLVPLQPVGSRPPLFFIHPLLGHVLCYRLLAHWLAPDQPVYGLQAQGVRPDQKPLTTVEDIAAAHLDTIHSFQPRGPYLLGGYSFGGLIAFEMARQLAARGEQVALLALLDTWCPGSRVRKRPLPERLRWRAAKLQRRGFRGGLAFLWRLLRRKLPAHLWRLEDVHYAAGKLYRPRPYAGRVLLLRAQGGPSDRDPTLGWGRWVTGSLEVRDVPGKHFSLMRDPEVRSVADILRPYLAEVPGGDQELSIPATPGG